MFLKVIACEIAVRELQYAAAHSKNLIDLEFLTQGHHDTPASGREEIQLRIDAVPAAKYDAILLGYALCSKILIGLKPSHTRLVIPRAHDCITLFLGSKERYQQLHAERPGTYYYTSGWLECTTRRGNKGSTWGGASLPANSSLDLQATYQQWVKKFGEDQAKYLVEEMSRWMETYSHGCLIDFDFLKQLDLPGKVQRICADKGWSYDQVPGDLSLFQRMLDGQWTECDFLTVQPGQKVVASFDEKVIAAEP
jgi:hypothetical protein